MIPSEPSEPNIPVTFATTLMSDGMNGMLPNPRTSRMIASAARLTPTSASVACPTSYLCLIFPFNLLPLWFNSIIISVHHYKHLIS